MRPVWFDNFEYRTVMEAQFPLGQLTVFFGKNNSGKTNALEALTRVLTGEEDAARRRPAVTRSFGLQGRVWLEARESGSHRDVTLRRSIYEALQGGAESDTPVSAEDATLDMARILAAASVLSEWGSAEGEAHATALAIVQELMQQSLVAVSGNKVALGYPHGLIPPEVDALVRQLEATRSTLGYVLGYSVDGQMDDDIGPWVRGPMVADVELDTHLSVTWLDWDTLGLSQHVEDFISSQLRKHNQETGVRRRLSWLIGPWDSKSPGYQPHPLLAQVAERLGELATELLPGFVHGRVGVVITSADLWDEFPRVLIEFEEHGATQCADVAELSGTGFARWIAAAVRLATGVLDGNGEHDEIAPPQYSLDGNFIVVDEPEAHLHPHAVASVVSWCRRMTDHGANVLVATHHDEFLRNVGEGATLIHVSKGADPSVSDYRLVDPEDIPALQEMAIEIGYPVASVLGTSSAILFVEGQLDKAMLEEYQGRALERAGVLVIPLSGTRNLEAFVASDFVGRLHLKLGVLTDATRPETLAERPNKQRSTEEKKIWRVLAAYEEKDWTMPEIFGVPQRDLLHVIPADGIRQMLSCEFPEWDALEPEARAREGVGGSESVHWKRYAFEQYGVPLDTEEGVRSIVRWCDLNGFAMPALAKVVEEVLAWARSREPTSDAEEHKAH